MTVVTTLRAEADPTTEILVLGASYTSRLASTAGDGINAAVAAAAAGHPDDSGHEQIVDRLEPVLRGLVGS